MKRLAALALLCGTLALGSGTAQTDKSSVTVPSVPREPSQTVRRNLYHLRHADPASLAAVLSQQYRGQAEISALADSLLVAATPAVLEEITGLLGRLDRSPRTVEVEIAIAEIAAPKAGKELSPADLLTEASKAGSGKKIKLTTVEGQPVTNQTGGNKPFVSGSTVPGGFAKGGGGFAQKSISYHSVGTTVKMTARVGADDAVSVDLNVQDSKVRPANAGDEAGAPSMDNSTLDTKLRIPAGKSVTAQAVRSEGAGGATIAVVVVTARIVPPEDAPKPKTK